MLSGILLVYLIILNYFWIAQKSFEFMISFFNADKFIKDVCLLYL
jgi:hypothetical protein